MLRIKLLQQRGWVRRSAGDVSGALDDLKAMISCAEDAKQLRLEVSGLLDLSRFCLYADRRQRLKIAAWAVEKSDGLDDDGFKDLVQGSRANLNLFLKNWSDEDAELCQKALKMTAEARDPLILIRRYSIEALLKSISSNYTDCVSLQSKAGNWRKRWATSSYSLYCTLHACASASRGVAPFAEKRRRDLGNDPKKCKSGGQRSVPFDDRIFARRGS